MIDLPSAAVLAPGLTLSCGKTWQLGGGIIPLQDFKVGGIGVVFWPRNFGVSCRLLPDGGKSSLSV